MDWIDDIVSAWIGHRQFAEFLVAFMKPKTIVELGVDYGFSTFVFGNALQKENFGFIYGIDLFEGDIHTGFRNTYNHILINIKEHQLTQVKIIAGDFTKVSQNWKTPINILHIDGLHTYAAVENDYNNWSKFVEEDGIILFHDIIAFEDIAKFFRNVDDNWYKLYFTHSAGLGILTKNTKLIEAIFNNFNVFDYSKIPF